MCGVIRKICDPLNVKLGDLIQLPVTHFTTWWVNWFIHQENYSITHSIEPICLFDWLYRQNRLIKIHEIILSHNCWIDQKMPKRILEIECYLNFKFSPPSTVEALLTFSQLIIIRAEFQLPNLSKDLCKVRSQGKLHACDQTMCKTTSSEGEKQPRAREVHRECSIKKLLWTINCSM